MIYTKSIVSAGPQAVSPLATTLQDTGAGAPLVGSNFFFCFDVCDFGCCFSSRPGYKAWDETWAELEKKRGKDVFRLDEGKKKIDQQEGMRVSWLLVAADGDNDDA